jgi:hypothetical protein
MSDDILSRAKEIVADYERCEVVLVLSSALEVCDLAREVVRLSELLSKQQKAHAEWMDAGAKAGYVFGVTSQGFTVERNPELAQEISACNAQSELEAENERLTKHLEAENRRIRRIVSRFLNEEANEKNHITTPNK